MTLRLGQTRAHAKLVVSQRMLWLTLICGLQTGCTTFIPGVDRVLFRNSSAQVGPLVTTEQQYPTEISADGGNQATPADKEVVVVEEVAEVEEVSRPENAAATAVDKQEAPAAPLAHSSPVDSSPTKPTPRVTPPKPVATVPSAAPTEHETALNEIAIEYGSVAGKVVLTGGEGQALPSTGTMITLTPTTMSQNELDRQPQVHIIDMEDKAYQPRYSAIHAGDQVVFVNKDNIRHNVFSSSGNNAFDLGTYGAGLKRAVALKEPGIVKIYCNIHSEMATFIAVGNQGLSTKVDDQGRYRIQDVLPGTYEMSIWNIRGETKQEIKVSAGKTTNVIDRIDTTAFKVEPHKNKFGGKYSKNATLFEDEFY
ncbi:hypothetical protein GCM10008090_15480 [Arenicella chitinivorans]|uniref:Rhamnogalacturonan lyase domain-containing protein n=1 Tax=Arenicella chitinivorans TaxID=1329800 RepID=A0A918RNF1_9GAMM|nr:hypothetical protein [Arenicella chitinivorans]GHA06717.1 hypothetical protein GCM10008090_15480 [Arenicella chitinivorans]